MKRHFGIPARHPGDHLIWNNELGFWITVVMACISLLVVSFVALLIGVLQ
jgi:hypothetical protein